jgi:ParB-like chromosome segregation protein Spo0J
MSALSNFHRAGHTDDETLKMVYRLRDSMGLNPTTIGLLVGKSAQWVEQRLRLRKLDPRVLAMMGRDVPSEKRLRLSAALKLVNLPPELQLTVATEIVSKSLSATGATFAVRHAARGAGVVAYAGRGRRPSDDLKMVENAVGSSIGRIREVLRVSDDVVRAMLNDRTEHARNQVRADLRTLGAEVAQLSARLDTLWNSS